MWQEVWCIGCCVDTIGRNKKVIEEYIRNQIQDDIVAEQLSMMEYLDPFTNEEVNWKIEGLWTLVDVSSTNGEPFSNHLGLLGQ